MESKSKEIKTTTKKTKGSPSQGVRWCYTLNNPEYPISFNQHSMVYQVYGEEVGESGTPHHQGFIVFKNRKRITQLKELNDKAHWELAQGTNQQASDYCKKDGKYHEFGILPAEPVKIAAKASSDKWRTINDLAKAGNLDEIDRQYPKVWNQSYKNLKQIKVDHLTMPAELEDVCGYWYYGVTGVGKTTMAREKHPNAYFKLPNKWWDGYQGQDNVIIDDLDVNHAYMGYHLKIWTDKFSFLAEVKNSTVVARPKSVIVTSQYKIEDIWRNEPETVAALKRRFIVREVINTPLGQKTYVVKHVGRNPKKLSTPTLPGPVPKVVDVLQKIKESIPPGGSDSEGEEPKSNTIEEEEVSEGEFTMLDAMVLEAEADAARLKQFQESMIVDQNQKIKNKPYKFESIPTKLKPKNEYFPDTRLQFKPVSPRASSPPKEAPPVNNQRLSSSKKRLLKRRLQRLQSRSPYVYPPYKPKSVFKSDSEEEEEVILGSSDSSYDETPIDNTINQSSESEGESKSEAELPLTSESILSDEDDNEIEIVEVSTDSDEY